MADSSDYPINRLNAALEDRYAIERKLGEGGMATVYLAEDLRHERKVALKVLKPELAAVIGAERFLAEIKTTANLQHPHILPLYDSGETDGFLYYVMPYVEGESLREKLDRERQLGVDEALQITKAVASALQYAHDRDVIHRDIKPENILLHAGEPVVADFGIALALSAAGGGRMTETGLSLGTPHYMSPEQATADRDLSARSDVYSLACVLYEMLAGDPPHIGPTAQAILMRILTEEPRSVTDVRKAVPPHVQAVLVKALEKLPADRFETAEQFAAALENEGFTYARRRPKESVAEPAPVVVSAPAAGIDRRLFAAVSTVAVVALVWAAWGWLRPTPTTEPGVPTRADVMGLDLGNQGGWRLAISPDGRWIVAGHAGDASSPALYIRTAEDTDWRRLPNTEGATNPTFSPDGQSVAFSNSGAISKVPITGGPALPVAAGTNPHWGLNDTIVYNAGGTLYRVGSSGDEPELLLDSDSLSVVRAHLLPNGKAVVFGTGAAPDSRIFLFEIETGEVRELVPAGNQPRYVRTGHLIYGHGDGALMDVPFDIETLQATGSPVTLLPALSVYGGGASQFAVSETGTLIYDASSRGGLGGGRILVEVNLEGVESPLPLSAENMDAPRYSPDGSKIAYGERSASEIRVYDVVTGASPQFASGAYPVWSTTGEYLYFSDQTTTSDGHRRPADSRDPGHTIVSEDLVVYPESQVIGA